MPVLDPLDGDQHADDDGDRALQGLDPQQQLALLNSVRQHATDGREQQHGQALRECDHAQRRGRAGQGESQVAVGHHLHLHHQRVGLVANPVRPVMRIVGERAEYPLQRPQALSRLSQLRAHRGDHRVTHRG